MRNFCLGSIENVKNNISRLRPRHRLKDYGVYIFINENLLQLKTCFTLYEKLYSPPLVEFFIFLYPPSYHPFRLSPKWKLPEEVKTQGITRRNTRILLLYMDGLLLCFSTTARNPNEMFCSDVVKCHCCILNWRFKPSKYGRVHINIPNSHYGRRTERSTRYSPRPKRIPVYQTSEVIEQNSSKLKVWEL